VVVFYFLFRQFWWFDGTNEHVQQYDGQSAKQVRPTTTGEEGKRAKSSSFNISRKFIRWPNLEPTGSKYEPGNESDAS